MEAVGVGIGLVSLAGLFSTCIDCLETIQRGLTLGKDFLLLETKFTNQCIRLRAWGRACQITEASRYDSLVDDIGARRQIEATLVQIHKILTSGIKLCGKYSPQSDQPTNTAMTMPSTLQAFVARSSNVAMRFGQRLSEIKEKSRLVQKNTSYMNTIRWAVDEDRHGRFGFSGSRRKGRGCGGYHEGLSRKKRFDNRGERSSYEYLPSPVIVRDLWR